MSKVVMIFEGVMDPFSSTRYSSEYRQPTLLNHRWLLTFPVHLVSTFHFARDVVNDDMLKVSKNSITKLESGHLSINSKDYYSFITSQVSIRC